MSTLTTILIFLLVLGVLVCIHEFGHFITAKRAGIRVDEFGFGFPPRIFGRKFRGTLYTLNWIPLGGFVKIKGVAGDDDQVESALHDKDSFASKPFHIKFLILFAGIGMNIVLAMVLFAITFFAGVPSDPANLESQANVSHQRLVITQVIAETPAAQQGVQPGDVITQVNGTTLDTTQAFKMLLADKPEGTPVVLTVLRDGATTTIEGLSIKEIQTSEGAFTGIGVGLQDVVTASYPWYMSIWLGIKTAVVTIGQIFISLVDLVKNIFSSGTVGEDVAGPIGIARITGQVAELGIIALLQFAALLSVNLAVFNLLPIPALDGGRIAFVVLEKIRRKPVEAHIEAIVHNIGFVLLLMLVLLVTFKDLSQLSVFSFLSR